MAGRFTVETVFKGTDQTSSVLGTISAKTKAFQKALVGPASIVDKGWSGLKQVGIAAGVASAGAVGLGLAFKEAIAPGADFDQAMAAVGAVSLKSRKDVADLEKEARRLGKTTKFSATEVAGGMELMGKAGFENSDIIRGIGPMLSAAAAEGAGFEETASVISNTIKGMGMGLEATANVADVLTLASAKTNSSITSLGESMAIVAPTARQLKVPFKDAVAAVAMLQDKGLDASVAGSAVATMLTNLAKPPKEVAAKMRAMGISFQDAHGDMLPFRDVIGQLAKAGTKAGGNMAQVAFFADLVGMRGQKAALNLKDIGPELAKLTDELGAANGKAAEMAALKMDSFVGDVTLLGNEVKDLGIDFFDLAKGPLRDAAQGARGWLADNQELIKSDVAGWVKGITANIGPMRQNIEKGIAVIGGFKNGLVDAFQHAESVKMFGSAWHTIFGGNDKGDPASRARDLGRSIGDATDKFIRFTMWTKAAGGALWLFDNGAKVAKAGKWLWDMAGAAEAAAKSAKALSQVGPANIVALSNAINGVGGGFGAAAENAGRMNGMRAAVNATFDSWRSQALLTAGAVAAIGLAYEQASKLADISGGWQGEAEGFGGGMMGFFGSGTKSWGVNGFLEGYNQSVGDYQNQQAWRDYKGEKDQWGDRSAVDAARQLSGFGAGFGATRNDFAHSFAGAPGRMPGPYMEGYQMPAQPLASARDTSAATAERTNELLAQILAKTGKEGAGGTVKLSLPPGVTADASGAPGVQVAQTGGF